MRAHLGVDFAAPIGTPVRVSADGVVTQAGVDGGYGKVVRMRHPNGYTTLYGHLSKINVKVGQHLTQRTVLGLVGMTGLATGPHLDYRMTKNGVFVNPLKIQSPPAEPISADEEDAFQAARNQQLALLGPAAGGTAVAQAESRTPRGDVRAASGAAP
jgi:murein DD-endopeptidase MepM/ murein hydrolase activator NlpD